MRIAFVTTCKGRVQHLRETLLRNINDNLDYDNCVFVVLSYGDRDGLDQYMQSAEVTPHIDSGKLVYYRHAAPDKFQMAHAKNMAHRCGMLENADALVNLDADNFTGRGFATYLANTWARRGHGAFLWARMVPGDMARGISGRIAVTRQQFLCAGGYDEQFKQWSQDDKDFNLRLRRLGFSPLEIDRRFLDSVRHNDKMRFREYPHAAKGNYYNPVDWAMTCDSNVANWGAIGCGTVHRSWSSLVFDLAPLPTRVFGIGMHKTATTSLYAAFKRLGYDAAHWTSAHWAKQVWSEMHAAVCRCGHGYDAHWRGTHHGDAECTTTVGNGERCDCANYRPHYRSVALERHYAFSDIPFNMLYRELDRGYPGSKFVLTTVDEGRWLDSVERHWSWKHNPWRVQWDTDPFTHHIHKVLYGRRDFNRESFLARYRRHNADVMVYFKQRPQDLLVMDMTAGAGYPELCRFLGEPVPSDATYPQGNSYKREHGLTWYQRERRRKRWAAAEGRKP